MAQGQPQLSVVGVPIRFELTFFVIIGLLGATVAPSAALLAAWVAVATISIVLHELGHALAYKAFGHDSHVVLMGFGGVTTGPRPPGRSIVVSLAGPLSGIFLLGLPAWAVAQSDLFTGDDARLVLFFFVWVNLIWAFINLLPVLPLDGGNVTQSAIELVTGRDAERVTRIVSIVVAGVGGVLSLATGYLFGVLFAGFFVVMNVNGLRQAKVPEIRVALGEAQRALSMGDTTRAATLADELVARRPPRDLLAVALEIAAWSKLLQGDPGGAAASLARLPKEVRAPPTTLTGAVAVAAGRVDEGLTLLAWGFVHDRDQGSKVFAAASAAQAGQAVPLVRTLLALDDSVGLEAAWKVQVTLHQLGRFADSAEVGRALLADGRLPGGEVGYHIARSLVRAGSVDDGLHWLNWVVDQGALDPARLAADPDLAALRGTPDFAALRQRASVTLHP